MASTRLARLALFSAGLMAFAATAHAEWLLPPKPVSLETLADFQRVSSNWRLAGGLGGDPRSDRVLAPQPGTGVLVNVPGGQAKGPLISAWEHGDAVIELEFLLPPRSNSGVYVQGRYEVQLFDSWGADTLKVSDSGAIYERWDAARGEGKEGFDGHPPRANASRAPGLWQRLQIEFRAPRFDASGRKTANARFVKVVLNGFVVQSDVEVTGPTRGSFFDDEKPTGPMIIQGDHGSIALRQLAVSRYEAGELALKELALKFYAGDFGPGWVDFEKLTPTREAAAESFSNAVTTADGRGAAVFTGKFTAPVAGTYGFEARGVYAARLVIDGQAVISPNFGGRHFGRVELPAGEHVIRFEHPRGAQRSMQNLRFFAEGPGLAAQLLGVEPSRRSGGERAAATVPVEPVDRVLVQRTFVPFDGAKRIYAAAVGSPTGTHYAYDLESATLLRVWRGGFLDATNLWVERAYSQVAEPTGPSLTLGGQPLLALLADGETAWPKRPMLDAASRGFRTEADGQPVFLYRFVGVSVEDRIAARPHGHGLSRALRFTGRPVERHLWVLLAESATITPRPDGRSFIVGDREYYIDLPADAPLQPMVRTVDGRQQLVLPLPPSDEAQEFSYNLVW